MKHSALTLLAMMLVVGVASLIPASANDAVYYTRASELVPIHETDISVSSEVLSISLHDDGYARVTVEYKFLNHGAAKVVDMGFEATGPYNSEDKMDVKVGHPYIHDFTVMMNGENLPYKIAIVEPETFDKPFVKPSDPDMMDFARYSYAYTFKAHFKEGMNSVRHTYRFMVSNGIARTFIIPYWLTPAARWKGGKIGDFTLRISAPATAKHFSVPADVFAAADFKVVKGKGKIRKANYEIGGDVVEIALRDGTVEWHKTEFVPEEDFEITSMDAYTFFDEDAPLGIFYDRSETYVPIQYGRKANRRILRNLPFANRGYVFKDKKLNKYFNSLWWYMPDPTVKADTKDFTPREWRLINKGE